tara:strand:- start:2864 stop:2980 length:117 start_codon:yes stop_codon:yes gene_type:complete
LFSIPEYSFAHPDTFIYIYVSYVKTLLIMVDELHLKEF